VTRRQVRFAEQFFDRLDELLPPERPGDGGPSASDFLLHDLPNVIDALAESYEGVTIPSGKLRARQSATDVVSWTGACTGGRHDADNQ
jgi:hypothetical protein